MAAHLINLDTTPRQLGWSLESHAGGGQFVWSPDTVKLSGDLEGAVREKTAMNGNVLDYLLEHKDLIPKQWEGCVSILFSGTVYRQPNGDLMVRSLSRVAICADPLGEVVLRHEWRGSTEYLYGDPMGLTVEAVAVRV